MLKYGPIPSGDFSYLICDGKKTNFARWLLISSDLDLNILDLCILVKIIYTLDFFAKHDVPQIMLRSWIYDQFEFLFAAKTISNSLTALTEHGLIYPSVMRSVSYDPTKVQPILSLLGDDFMLLYEYIEKVMQYNVNSPLF